MSSVREWVEEYKDKEKTYEGEAAKRRALRDEDYDKTNTRRRARQTQKIRNSHNVHTRIFALCAKSEMACHES